MKTDYKKLWKLLIDHNMTKSDLKAQTGISSVTLAKLGKGESVTTAVLLRICKVLNCGICDIVDTVNEVSTTNLTKKSREEFIDGIQN